MEPALVIYSGLVMTNRLFLVKFSRTYFESSEAIPSKLKPNQKTKQNKMLSLLNKDTFQINRQTVHFKDNEYPYQSN
jgi:hypothetical protein